jgi:hypothetical protein
MKARSPWGLYAAVFATGGLFIWVWLIKLMNDVNEIAGRHVFPTKLLSLFFVMIVAAYFALFAITPHTDPDIPGLSYDPSLLVGFGIVMTLLPPILLVHVSRFIDAAAGRPPSMVANLKVFLLTVFMYIGFPMVQQSMNDLLAGQNESA